MPWRARRMRLFRRDDLALAAMHGRRQAHVKSLAARNEIGAPFPERRSPTTAGIGLVFERARGQPQLSVDAGNQEWPTQYATPFLPVGEQVVDFVADMQDYAESRIAMFERNRDAVGSVAANKGAGRDTEEALERDAHAHAHAADGAQQQDTITADFNETRSVVRPLIAGGETDWKRKGVEPQAARPCGERLPVHRDLTPQFIPPPGRYCLPGHVQDIAAEFPELA